MSVEDITESIVARLMLLALDLCLQACRYVESCFTLRIHMQMMSIYVQLYSTYCTYVTGFVKRSLPHTIANIEKSRFDILNPVYLENAWTAGYESGIHGCLTFLRKQPQEEQTGDLLATIHTCTHELYLK